MASISFCAYSTTDKPVANEVIVPLDIGQFEVLSALVEGLYAFSNLVDAATGFQWRLHFYAAYDSRLFPSTPTGQIVATTSATGYIAHTPYLPAAGFPLRLKLAVGYNSATAGTLTAGTLSLSLMWILRS